MASPSPSAPGSPAQVSKHPTLLPATRPGNNYTVFHVTSSLSTSRSTFSRGLDPSVSPRTLVTNGELGGNQGRITMQTRVAVRDATPHRFQVLPLREAKSRNNLSEPCVVGAKDLKCRTRASQSTDWQPASVPPLPPSSHTRSNFSPLLGRRGGHSPNRPHILSLVEKVEVQGKDSASGNAEYQLPLASRDASKAVYPQDRRRPGLLRPGKPLHALSAGSISSTKAQSNQLAPKATWGISADHRTCHVSNRTKARACSEDLTRHQSKATRNCVYERLLCSRDDSSWGATKRHAIYSDTLVLPLFSPELDSVGPQQISVAPTSLYSQGPAGHCGRHCIKPCYIEDVFGPQASSLASKITTSSQSEQNFIPRKFPVRNRPLTEPSLYPSVPHLRLSRGARDAPTFRKSTLNIVRGWPLKHPKIILNLLLQLDQAIEEWNSLGREYAEEQSRVQAE